MPNDKSQSDHKSQSDRFGGTCGFGNVTALSAALLLFLAGAAAGGTVDTHLPQWSLPWAAIINFTYAFVIIITLCARRFSPGIGRVLTRILNWALLPAIPGGTIVGLHGLLRTDRKSR